MRKHCTQYYYPVKSSCRFEKIGGVFWQPHHNVGVLFIFKTEETHEATLTWFFFFPHTFRLIIHWKLTKVLEEFPGFGCKLCGLSLSSQNRSFPLHGRLQLFLEYLNWSHEGQQFKCVTIVSLCYRLVVCLH